MESKENVKKYYDDYVGRQRKYGITPRHRFILKRLKKFGLKSTSKVLEIGSGIGTLSVLIVNEVNKGYFLGCDISEVSINVCNAELKRSYTDFLVTDMSDFKSEIKFDFIVLPDVLEHIPVNEHALIFENVSKCVHEDSIVVINIPEPKYLNWVRNNRPDLLQIIDQSLSLQDLLNNTYSAGFYVEEILPYAIHTNVPNYLSIVFSRKKELSEMKIKGGFGKLWDNIKYRFL
jgi:cyclopropane fatty-acyl-phospholipid synthase-like methyltransferase